MTPIRKLAGFIHNTNIENIPKTVVEAAKYCVLDTVGSALGAINSLEIAAISKEYENWCGLGIHKFFAPIWGRKNYGNMHHALMINGSLAHELELDDVHTGSKSHIGAVVIPTAWTLASAIGATGKEFLEAVIIGYEIMGRIGEAMDVASNRKRGWHTTGIIGTFGAAAVSAKLLNLTIDQTVNALGIAGTQSSGLWAFLNEGATCKKLHCARAAINGFDASLLAKAGMTGAEHILDAKDGGLYQAVSDSYSMDKLTENLGSSYVLLQIDKKPYPCCRTTHHAIDGAIKLAEDVNPKDIASILVETYDIGVLQCGFEKYPQSNVEAKFSIPFCVAAAFVNKKVTQEEFTDKVLNSAEIKRIATNTKVVSDNMFTKRYPKRWGSRITVTTFKNTKHTCQIDDMSGSVESPLTPTQEKNKFLSLVIPILGADKGKSLSNLILNIGDINVLPNLS